MCWGNECLEEAASAEALGQGREGLGPKTILKRRERRRGVSAEAGEGRQELADHVKNLEFI